MPPFLRQLFTDCSESQNLEALLWHAGREDFDVRMLGSGRPFVLEVINARAAVPPQSSFDAMQAALEQVDLYLPSNSGLVLTSSLFDNKECMMHRKRHAFVVTACVPQSGDWQHATHLPP